MKINRNNLAVSEFAVTKIDGRGMRTSLTKVMIDGDAGYTIATNGYYLVKVDLPEQQPKQEPVESVPVESVVLPAESARQQAKRIAKGAQVDLASVRDLVPGNLATNTPAVIAQCTSGDPIAEVALNAEYLAKIAKFIAGTQGKTNPVLIRIYADKHRAVTFDAETADGQHVQALLMPMRDIAGLSERYYPEAAGAKAATPAEGQAEEAKKEEAK